MNSTVICRCSSPCVSDVSGQPRLLVVQHEVGTGPGWFGEWLSEAGLALDVCHPYAGDELPPATTYDGAVVLGGAMAPAEDERCPWLPAVRRLMADAVASSVPLLGICLGAQLLALACGGAVRRGRERPRARRARPRLAPRGCGRPALRRGCVARPRGAVALGGDLGSAGRRDLAGRQPQLRQPGVPGR